MSLPDEACACLGNVWNACINYPNQGLRPGMVKTHGTP